MFGLPQLIWTRNLGRAAARLLWEQIHKDSRHTVALARTETTVPGSRLSGGGLADIPGQSKTQMGAGRVNHGSFFFVYCSTAYYRHPMKKRVNYCPLMGFVISMMMVWAIGCTETPKASLPIILPLRTERKVTSLRDTASRRALLEHHYRKRNVFRSSKMKEQEARSLLEIAQLICGDSSERSLRHLTDALAIAGGINNAKLSAEIYLAISGIHKSRQNYRLALAALERHHQLVDSLSAVQVVWEELALRTADRNALERMVAVIVMLSAIMTCLAVGYFYIRGRRLNKKLMDINDLKDRLFSVIGHDLRGPAGSLVQALDMFAERAGSHGENMEMLPLLQEQSRALSGTIETLFHWANSQRQEATASASDFNATEGVGPVLELLRAQGSQKGVSLLSEVPPDLLVRFDSDHFSLIIRNLVSTAIKFSLPGGTVVVSGAAKGREVVCSVSDQGIGMDAARLRLLDSGKIGSSFGTRGEKGSGLGLQLVVKLLEINGGRLWIHSIVGMGSTIFFSVPAAVAEDDFYNT